MKFNLSNIRLHLYAACKLEVAGLAYVYGEILSIIVNYGNNFSLSSGEETGRSPPPKYPIFLF